MEIIIGKNYKSNCKSWTLTTSQILERNQIMDQYTLPRRLVFTIGSPNPNANDNHTTILLLSDIIQTLQNKKAYKFILISFFFPP